MLSAQSVISIRNTLLKSKVTFPACVLGRAEMKNDFNTAGGLRMRETEIEIEGQCVRRKFRVVSLFRYFLGVLFFCSELIVKTNRKKSEKKKK